jgi:hypothetical protein
VSSVRAPSALIALIALASCSKSTREPIPDEGPGTFGGDAGPKVAECAEATKNVFVLAEDRSLYSFNPPSLTFTKKGLLNCDTGGTPSSMAVDRDGIAWVRHSDSTLWKVSTRDLTCQPTTYKAAAGEFTKFGMGFATETRGGSSEVLYLSDSFGGGLAKLDTKTLAFTAIGPYTGALAGSKAELTGTGDGKLYGFFVTSPAQIAEISPTTGAIVETKSLTGVEAGDAWAFSFYGGDFFVYTNAVGAVGGSDVTQYKPSDGSVTVVKPKIGFKIVGAGVSTCAPTGTTR